MTTTLTPKAFAELFTFVGASQGTFTNAQGWIQPKPAGAVPRFDHDPITKAPRGLLIEGSRANLILLSSRFEYGAWSKTNAVVTPFAAVAPNGRWDACKLVLTTAGAVGNGRIAQTVSKSAGAATFAYSFYAKAAGAQNGFIYVANAANSAHAVSIPFNLQTMTIAGAALGDFVEVSKRIIDVGNGWRRVEIVFTTDAASTVLLAAIYSGTASGTGLGNGVDGLYIWGAQLEVGAFPSSYILNLETFSGRTTIGSYFDSKGVMRYAAAGVARESYEPSNLTLAPNLLAEEQRTNVLLKSGDMHLSPWQSGGMTRAAGKLAPDGTLRAVEFSGAATAPTIQTATATATVMTYSIYVKNVSRTASVEFLMRNDTTAVNGTYGTVSLQDATPAITGIGWEMRSVGNGWFRCTYTSAFPIAVGDLVRCYAVNAGVRADAGSCLVWGAQLEAGSYATSYIPSTETFTGRASIGTYFDSTGAMKTAASGAARMTYNPADLTIAPWLMQELQSKNILLQSGQLSASPWAGSTSKTEAAEKYAGIPYWEVKKTLASTSESATQGGLTAATIGDAFTATCVLLAGTSNQVSVGLHNGTTSSWGNTADRQYEIVSGPGTVSTSTGALIYIANLSPTVPTIVRVTRTYTEAGSVSFIVYPGTAGSATIGDSIKIACPQVEAGLVATSYIPTTTVAVTRLADAVTSTVTARAVDGFSSVATTRAGDQVRVDTSKGWCNSAEGTIFMEFGRPITGDSTTRNLVEIGTAIANRVGIGFTVNGDIYGYWVVNGASGPGTTPSSLTGTPVGGPVKMSLSYGADGLRVGCNGQLKKAAQVAVPPLAFLGIGNLASGSNQPFFHVRAVRYRPQKLTDAEVTALTA